MESKTLQELEPVSLSTFVVKRPQGKVQGDLSRGTEGTGHFHAVGRNWERREWYPWLWERGGERAGSELGLVKETRCQHHYNAGVIELAGGLLRALRARW